MRISSNTLYDSNVAAMSQQQAKLFQTQQQVASGKRMLNPSDDPVAAVKALELNQADAMNTQYASNRDAATHTLSMAEGALDSVTSLLLDVRTAMVSAGNPLLTATGRNTIATELSGRLQELIGLANSTDGNGNFLFAGFQSKTQPFADTPAGVAYFGDDGQRMAQASASRQMATSESGANIFMRIKNGNGVFATQPAATNAGSGVISTGSVTSPALLKNDSYQISFSVVGGVTTYSVTGQVQGAVVPAGTPYVSGQAISFDGMQVSVLGAPADGDAFTVTPSTNESVFKTISDMITALKAPAAGVGLSNGINRGLKNLDNAIESVTTARTSFGLGLKELDALQVDGENLGLQFKQSLSLLQDVDYNKAVTDLTMQQTALQAALQSFSKISGLSLFNYLQ